MKRSLVRSYFQLHTNGRADLIDAGFKALQAGMRRPPRASFQ